MARRLADRLMNADKFAWRRRAFILAAIALVLVAGYFLWFRDSSLVAVEEVKVEGATANEEEIGAALAGAAGGMSTLNVDEQKLARAVAGFPTVASIRADAGFPHSLTIIVNERLPVAEAELDGERVAVSADGFVLPGVDVRGAKLPSLDEDASARGGVLTDEGAAQAAALGGAPSELRERIESAAWDPERGGVVVELEGAPELRFGGGEDSELKWRAVAAVLSDPEFGSPAYVDVSVPERPVAGG